MKRQKNKHRFYLWDYLWWTGERLHDYHSRITGDDMLQMHFMFFVYFPILMLCAFAKPAFVNRSFFIYLLAFYFVLLLVWWIWNKQIYRASRRKAVMKHYADVNFNPGKGFLLFFMPLIFFYWCGYNHLFTDGIETDMCNLNKQFHRHNITWCDS